MRGITYIVDMIMFLSASLLCRMYYQGKGCFKGEFIFITLGKKTDFITIPCVMLNFLGENRMNCEVETNFWVHQKIEPLLLSSFQFNIILLNHLMTHSRIRWDIQIFHWKYLPSTHCLFYSYLDFFRRKLIIVGAWLSVLLM